MTCPNGKPVVINSETGEVSEGKSDVEQTSVSEGS